MPNQKVLLEKQQIVAELKEKIDRQIVVKKDRSGSSRASIIV